MSFLRTNYRMTGSKIDVAFKATVAVQSGDIYFSGASILVWRTAATFVCLAGAASGSIADL